MEWSLNLHTCLLLFFYKLKQKRKKKYIWYIALNTRQIINPSSKSSYCIKRRISHLSHKLQMNVFLFSFILCQFMCNCISWLFLFVEYKKYILECKIIGFFFVYDWFKIRDFNVFINNNNCNYFFFLFNYRKYSKTVVPTADVFLCIICKPLRVY